MDEVEFRGYIISRQDIARAMAEFDEKSRVDFIHWRTYGVREGERIYPPKEIIRIATNYQIGRFSGGENAANQVFRRLGFDIVFIGDNDITEVEIDEALDTSLSLERDLERILLTDLSMIEDGLSIYKEGDITGVQFETGVVGRLDILALDTKGRFVVIELKAGEASDRVCGQIMRYMGWVRQEMSPNKDVRGIIVANDFNVRAKYAASMVSLLELRKYDVSFDISQVN